MRRGSGAIKVGAVRLSGQFTLGFGTRAEGGQALLDVLASSETLSGQCQGWQPAHGFIAPVALV
jgi:hypothetical protein